MLQKIMLLMNLISIQVFHYNVPLIEIKNIDSYDKLVVPLKQKNVYSNQVSIV